MTNQTEAHAEAILRAAGDVIAEHISERILTEFKGFWAPEDLVEELPGMIRLAAADALKLRRASAILDAVREAMGQEWLPIESAPKDGTSIIIAVTGGPHGATVCEAYFCVDDEYGSEWWLASTGPANYYHGPISDIMHGAVSHWQPLPAPPLTLATGDKQP